MDTTKPAGGAPLDAPVRPDPERAAFEAWCDVRWGNCAYLHKSATCGEWAAWQAAVAAERERNAGWFALVMNAAAALEDAANCLRDPDAKRAAEGAAKHYREAANAMWGKCVGPNVNSTADPAA